MNPGHFRDLIAHRHRRVHRPEGILMHHGDVRSPDLPHFRLAHAQKIDSVQHDTASLDPATAQELRAKILKRVQESSGAVLWTSHNMREIETVSDRIVFLSRGQIIADATPQTLKKRFGQEDLEEIFITIAKKPISKSL